MLVVAADVDGLCIPPAYDMQHHGCQHHVGVRMYFMLNEGSKQFSIVQLL
jgi:hypothetical protein